SGASHQFAPVAGMRFARPTALPPKRNPLWVIRDWSSGHGPGLAERTTMGNKAYGDHRSRQTYSFPSVLLLRILQSSLSCRLDPHGLRPFRRHHPGPVGRPFRLHVGPWPWLVARRQMG